MAREFHVILDEMNLARVEHYFSRFLSAMEVRTREGIARLDLAPGHTVELTPNLKFSGTVNIDETTHGFADKVYDRAQILELPLPREQVAAHMAEFPWKTSSCSCGTPWWRSRRSGSACSMRSTPTSSPPPRSALRRDPRARRAAVQKVLPRLRGDSRRRPRDRRVHRAHRRALPAVQPPRRGRSPAGTEHAWIRHLLLSDPAGGSSGGARDAAPTDGLRRRDRGGAVDRLPLLPTGHRRAAHRRAAPVQGRARSPPRAALELIRSMLQARQPRLNRAARSTRWTSAGRSPPTSTRTGS